MTQAVPIIATPFEGPRGYGGIVVTLEKMVEIIVAFARHPRWKLFTHQVLKNAGAKEYEQEQEVRALWSWVRSNIRYVRDPHNFEWLQTPTVSVLWRSGDCDCQTILLASMLMSIGYPVRLVIVGNEPPPGKPVNFHHVYLSALFRREGASAPTWTDLDPTVDQGFGLPVLHPRRQVFDISPDGKLRETKGYSTMNGLSYGLGDFLGDMASPDPGKLFTATVEDDAGNEHIIKVPWEIRDLRWVSEADIDRWLVDLKLEGKPPEAVAAVFKMVAHALASPALAAEADLPPDEALMLGALEGFGGLGGFWKNAGKSLKKAAIPIAAVAAAPLTGGASLAVAAAAAGAKGMKGRKGGAAPGGRAPREKKPKKAKLEITSGQGVVPEVKSNATRNYMLAGAGVAAAGTGAYLLTRD